MHQQSKKRRGRFFCVIFNIKKKRHTCRDSRNIIWFLSWEDHDDSKNWFIFCVANFDYDKTKIPSFFVKLNNFGKLLAKVSNTIQLIFYILYRWVLEHLTVGWIQLWLYRGHVRSWESSHALLFFKEMLPYLPSLQQKKTLMESN